MIAKPLTRFLRDDAPHPQATPDALEAFDKLKQALLSAPILQTPNWEKPFLVFTDALEEGVGATLAQLDKEGYDHPIHYASRQLTLAEMNYTVSEQEDLGVVFALKKFRHYLLGIKATVVMDHQALIYLLNKPNATGRIARWIILLQEFDLKIVLRAGTKHGHVDFLSRMEKEVGIVSEDDDFPDAMLMSINIEDEPEEYKDIIRYLQSMNNPEGATKQIKTRIAHKSRSYTLLGQLLYLCGRDGILRRAVEKSDVPKLLREFHEGFCGGHFVRRVMVEKILAAGYYWPTMLKYTFDYCKRCEVCQAFANKSTVSGNLHPIPPLAPFEKRGIVFMGPLPVTKRGHRFIVVATDYFTKFAEVPALKTSVKKEVARFVYEHIVTHFDIPLEMVSDNGPQFTSDVWEDLMVRLAIKHRFTTKPSTNKLVE